MAAAQGVPARFIRNGMGVQMSVAAMRVHLFVLTNIASQIESNSRPALTILILRFICWRSLPGRWLQPSWAVVAAEAPDR